MKIKSTENRDFPKVKKEKLSNKVGLEDNRDFPVIKESKLSKKVKSPNDLLRNQNELEKLSGNISKLISQRTKLDISYIDSAVAQSLKWLKDSKLYIPYPVAVTFDWHIPHTSRRWVEKLLIESQRKRIKRLVIGGDFFDQQQFMFWMGVNPVSWNDECAAGTQLMDELLKFYEYIYIFLGNHDLRLWKQLGQRFDAKYLFKSVLNEAIIGTRVFISNLEYAETVDKKWIICHSEGSSDRGAAVPVDIAEKEMENVIGGHRHRLGAAKTKSGAFWGIDGGGMFEQQAFTYNGNVRKSKHPKMNNGFVILNEAGEFRLFGDGIDMN